MKLEVHFWDDVDSHEERKEFRGKLYSKGIKTSIDCRDLKNVDILFVHGGDSGSLNNCELRDSVFKINFGDNITKANPIFREENRMSYINAKVLEERFNSVYDKINSSKSLTLDRLYEIIFDFDPELEKLLDPFATYHPLDKMTITLEAQRTDLLLYIKSKLNGQ